MSTTDLEMDDMLLTKYNMAIKSQQQMFDVIDSGRYVKIKNVFTHLGFETPPEMQTKIDEYQIKADELLNKTNKLLNKVNTDVTIPVVNKIPIKTEVKMDYAKYKGACDIVPLPSNGKIYPIGKDFLEVGFLTAIDESILMQGNVSKTKEVFNLILKK